MSVELSLTRPPYLGQVFLVVDHAVDENVRLRLAEAENCFSSLIPAEVKSTNVDPSAPPDVPRLTLSDNHKKLSLAQTRMQFALSFAPDFDLEKAFQIIKKSASAFLVAAKKFQTLDERTQIGFIVEVNQPCEASKDLMAQHLAKNLYGGKNLGQLASFDLRLGFQTESKLFKNFAFNVYELKEFKLPPGKSGQNVVNLKINDIPTKEIGFASILDINNRPRLLGLTTGSSSISFENTVEEILLEMDKMLNSERHMLLPLTSVALQAQA